MWEESVDEALYLPHNITTFYFQLRHVVMFYICYIWTVVFFLEHVWLCLFLRARCGWRIRTRNTNWWKSTSLTWGTSTIINLFILLPKLSPFLPHCQLYSTACQAHHQSHFLSTAKNTASILIWAMEHVHLEVAASTDTVRAHSYLKLFDIILSTTVASICI